MSFLTTLSLADVCAFPIEVFHPFGSSPTDEVPESSIDDEASAFETAVDMREALIGDERYASQLFSSPQVLSWAIDQAVRPPPTVAHRDHPERDRRAHFASSLIDDALEMAQGEYRMERLRAFHRLMTFDLEPTVSVIEVGAGDHIEGAIDLARLGYDVSLVELRTHCDVYRFLKEHLLPGELARHLHPTDPYDQIQSDIVYFSMPFFPSDPNGVTFRKYCRPPSLERRGGRVIVDTDLYSDLEEFFPPCDWKLLLKMRGSLRLFLSGIPAPSSHCFFYIFERIR